MARALSIHLPPDLDTLGKALGLPSVKDKEGHALMMKMARPRKVYTPDAAKNVSAPEGPQWSVEWTDRPDGGLVRWWNTPENLAREGAYCDQDVVVESLVDEKLPPLSADERALWELDQRINDRGVMLDVATIERAVGVKAVAQRDADLRMAEITGGAVRKCSEVGKLGEWLRGRGVACDSLSKDHHDGVMTFADCLGDAAAREAVELRRDSTKTSTAKLDKMLQTVCADGRARGLFSYHRALTGRWGGASVQPQNLPRVDEDTELPAVMAAIDAMEAFS